MNRFQRPANWWLCFFSLAWIVGGVGFGFNLGASGYYLGACLMFLLAVLGGALWFQSKWAARVMIVVACLGGVNALLHLGQVPWYRSASRLCFVVWGISLLWEYLQAQGD